MPKGHLFVLVGPGGSGKTTLIRALLEHRPDIAFIPTFTTRTPRPNERHGYDYFFVSDAAFDAMIERAELLEWQWIHEHRYGTSRRLFEELIRDGRYGITSMDYKGGHRVKEAFGPDVTTIWVDAGSIDDLRARLVARTGATEEEVALRVARAAEEMDHRTSCDEVVVNRSGHLDEALRDLSTIVARYAPPPA